MALKPADDHFAAGLRTALPGLDIGPVPTRYLQEPRGRYRGVGGWLARPESPQQVAVIVAAANEADVAVVPYGGGTGLVGGQVMPEGAAPLILSLERMNEIRALYPLENVVVAGAGAILSEVQEAARAQERLFPLSLASEGSARIGGLLSTNAGGVNVLRYGNARDLCIGLEAVLPNGRIWSGLTRLRKDNTGYDLKNLLIGAEGTLGVITAAALKLAPIPLEQGTAILVVPSPQAALDLLAVTRGQLGEGVSAFELIHRQGLEFMAEVGPALRQPFETSPEWCVLIDLGLAAGHDTQTALQDLFAVALERGLASDGVIAQNESQRAAFWALREAIPAANRNIGSISSHDISLPLGVIPDFIARAPDLIARIGGFRINCFGHLGDGNLHYNVFPPKGRERTDYDNQRGAIKRAVYDLVNEMGGSISAEHGIGRLKVGDLERYGDPVRLDAMRAIKSALDPKGIMNPGAVLRS